MDGLEAVRRIRADAGIAGIPVVAVSASTMNGEVDRIREICNDFLSKPVQREELVRTLARFLPCRVHAAPAAPLAEATPAPPAAPQPEAVLPAPEPGEGAVEKWRELFSHLEHRLQEGAWGSEGVIVFDRVEALGVEMRELGRTYDCPRLTEWADQLLAQVRSIDVMNLPATLERFSGIVDGLRVHAAPGGGGGVDAAAGARRENAGS